MAVCEILPNLWLGNLKAAHSEEFLKKHHITLVINCSRDIPFLANSTKNIRISVNDNLEKSEIHRLYNYFSKAVDVIHDNLNDLQTILVHCYAGRQRSASLVAAYLMKYADMNYKEAINIIRSKRAVAFTPGVNFEEALIKFQKDLDVTETN